MQMHVLTVPWLDSGHMHAATHFFQSMRGRRYMKLCSRCGMNLHAPTAPAGRRWCERQCSSTHTSKGSTEVPTSLQQVLITQAQAS